MRETLDRVAKLLGSDVEIGNAVLGTGYADTAEAGARVLLRAIKGVAAERRTPVYGAWGGWSEGGASSSPSAFVNPQEWGRRYLRENAASCYVDMAHAELCTPEVVSCADFVAARHALLRIAQRAQATVNGVLPPGRKLEVIVNNSDGRSHSYGSHISVLLTRRAWENIFERRIHHMLFLAAFQISSIVFSGAGKVGAENGAPAVDFQLSARGDFFEQLLAVATTHRRPIVNARDEALSGSVWSSADPERSAYGRLHCIFFDSHLCEGSMYLTAGTMQIVLAMIEAERIDPRLILDEPLVALLRWGHDPELRARARTAAGRHVTAVELQESFLEHAARFVADGGCDGVVPRAEEIVRLWADTLAKLRRRDFGALVGRLDWVLKRHALERALARHPTLTWRAPAMKVLDHRYASLDADEGLYWAYRRAGVVERFVDDAHIARFEAEPPADTRAWTRAMLLRLAGAGRTDGLDWDWMRFAPAPGRRTGWRLELADPLGFTQADVGHCFAGSPTLDDVLDALGATPDDRNEAPAWVGHGIH